MDQDRRNVGRDKEFAVAQTDDDRRAFANCDDRVRLINRNDGQRENAAKLGHGFSNCKLQRQVFFIDVMPDQMCDDLGIGLGVKLMTVGGETLLERQIIFDNAVVNDDDLARLVAVRMRVFLGRTPVRRPTRVPDAVVAVERIQPDGFFEIPQLPLGTP